ncbi:unnamed protein product [Paramecium octaurelia]|uniref:Transmembrane protein n=1 Tax=Paramecium octaurelia TaxID=43137 RepID=A0A8S1X5Y2_PAROT|nr:unnamed protein product [Paramecium octaurelia]
MKTFCIQIEQFYFEISGNLKLSQCHKLLTKFTEMESLRYLFIIRQIFQIFTEFNQQTGNLGFQFENIKVDFQLLQFNNLTITKMVLKRCKFEKDKLQEDIIKFKLRKHKRDQCFTIQEQTELLEIQREIEQMSLLRYDLSILLLRFVFFILFIFYVCYQDYYHQLAR